MNHVLDTNSVASIYFLLFIRSGMSTECSCTCTIVQPGTMCPAKSTVKLRCTKKVRVLLK